MCDLLEEVVQLDPSLMQVRVWVYALSIALHHCMQYLLSRGFKIGPILNPRRVKAWFESVILMVWMQTCESLLLEV